MNIDKYLLEDIEYKEHPSEFESVEDYSILILRLPEFVKKKMSINSLAFVIKEDMVYRYDRETKEFKKLGNLSEFSDFLDDRLDALIKHLQRYHIELDNLEDELYENHINSNFISKWLQYKKDITLISRLTFHASLAFELFVNHQRKRLKKESFFHNDNLEHIKRIENLANLVYFCHLP